MIMRKVQSFVCRNGRMTDGQRAAFKNDWAQFGLSVTSGFIDVANVFQREAPCVLEIGFGYGHSLLELAKLHPERNFIGIEMHQPGIGALLMHMQEQQVTNIRIFYADAVEVLKKCIQDASLDVAQIFFPDPWRKRRHHKRRLIQPEFVNLIASKLKSPGTLHLATDWEDYAMQMMKVLSAAPQFINLAGKEQFAERSMQRPVATKFERRGERRGHDIWELQFAK